MAKNKSNVESTFGWFLLYHKARASIWVILVLFTVLASLSDVFLGTRILRTVVWSFADLFMWCFGVAVRAFFTIIPE